MPRLSQHAKEDSLNFRIDSKLKAEFQTATEAEDKPAAQVLRDFMRAYVERQRERTFAAENRPELTNRPPGTHKEIWQQFPPGSGKLVISVDRQIAPSRVENGPISCAENPVGLAECTETSAEGFSDRPSRGLCVPGGQFVTSGQFSSGETV